VSEVRVRPVGDRVLVQFDPLEDAEREIIPGVLAPARAVDDVHQWGTVLAVGAGRLTKKDILVPPQVAPGDRVLYIRYLKNTHTGDSIRASGCIGHDQFIIHEGDILAIEEGEEGAP